MVQQTTSAWWTTAQAIQSRLVAANAATYRVPGGTDGGCTVYLHQQVALDEGDGNGDYMVVAWPGEPDAESSPGQSEQTVATAGRYGRDETGTIAVRVVAQDGDTDDDVVGRAYGYVADLERLARADATLGLVPATFARLFWQVDRAEPQPLLNRGLLCPIDVTVSFTARI